MLSSNLMNENKSEKSTGQYSSCAETRKAFQHLLYEANLPLPETILKHVGNVAFTSAYDQIYFPCPFKETEAISALKAIEACVVACIADVRFGETSRQISINLEKATRFLFSTYLSTVDGFGKFDKQYRNVIKDTDLLQAQSNLYRRMSANLYETKRPGEYFHLHGSLEASTSLTMIGCEPYRDLTDYHEIIEVIESKMREFTLEELETLNSKNLQAGVTCYKNEDILKAEYGSIFSKPLWEIVPIEDQSLPATFMVSRSPSKLLAPLQGIKVLELCRIIAGPCITKTLAEYGADVLKITSSTLSDVPFFQIDGNMGKRTADLDLKSPDGRKIFEDLLQDVDILVDGYRLGALERLGYGPVQLAKRLEGRGKGIVYVNENCFGYGIWAQRPGWQQIADCVTGVAWAQGRFMGLDEPVVPPFPKSDYGTGCMGAIAAMTGLYKRTVHGGSYHCKVSLAQYDVLLFRLQQYPTDIQADLAQKFAGPFFDSIRHYDSVDNVSQKALDVMQRVVPELFQSKDEWMETWSAPGFHAGGEIRVLKPVASIEGLWNGFSRPSRPNGTDIASWKNWEDETGYRKGSHQNVSSGI